MSEHLQLEVQDHIATLTLNRPPANAMNHALIKALGAVLPRLSEPDVRAVLLKGNARFFSAGLDLFEVMTYDEATAAEFAADFDRAMRGWFALELPVVAALSGHAIAGGLVLAAMADFRIAAEGPGKLGLTEILVGVPFPISALEPVRAAFPSRVLAELLYRGTTYTMAEGLAHGLVDRLVAPDALDETARGLALELASRTRAGFSGTKAGLRAPGLARLDLAPGADPVWALWRSAEVQAQLAAYRAATLKKG